MRRSPAAVHEEDCAPRRVLDLFSGKWTSMILHALHELHGGTCRTGELQRSLPGISKKMLAQTLRLMERDGLLARQAFNVVPPHVEYSLTALGREFVGLIEMMYLNGGATIVMPWISSSDGRATGAGAPRQEPRSRSALAGVGRPGGTAGSVSCARRLGAIHSNVGQSGEA